MELMWWILDYFKILPTDERFQNLTNEQILFLVESKNNEIRRQERNLGLGEGPYGQNRVSKGGVRESFTDPSYEEWEKRELERLAKERQNKGWAEL